MHLTADKTLVELYNNDLNHRIMSKVLYGMPNKIVIGNFLGGYIQSLYHYNNFNANREEIDTFIRWHLGEWTGIEFEWPNEESYLNYLYNLDNCKKYERG